MFNRDKIHFANFKTEGMGNAFRSYALPICPPKKTEVLEKTDDALVVKSGNEAGTVFVTTILPRILTSLLPDS
jgi:hypothetical protein